jgi:hypothetical protein
MRTAHETVRRCDKWLPHLGRYCSIEATHFPADDKAFCTVHCQVWMQVVRAANREAGKDYLRDSQSRCYTTGTFPREVYHFASECPDFRPKPATRYFPNRDSDSEIWS